MNYTPFKLPKEKTRGSFPLKSSFIAFLTALVVISAGFYFEENILSKPVKTKASEMKTLDPSYCINPPVSNPSKVRVMVLKDNTLIKEVLNSDVVDTNSVTITWDPEPNATNYYIALGTKDPQQGIKGRIDPIINGVRLDFPYHTFKDLKSKTKYFVFIRSVTKDGNTGYELPSKPSCLGAYPAKSIFSFITK